ncbi:DMT family transporter [Clostridium sp. C105KSO13]|uniref:DMT family transporter n=1 Tax=Clostridium sp. C105KSO13 TaxID=1776045 RepID=UPI0007406C42|nr:EamA family transporter [Clostridium sp. C105KSO13]CUX27435.1 putative inner membrane transporter YhbE [Clostridium sp. C105KSO13]
MKIFKSFHIYALTTTIFWSLAYVLTRLNLEHFSAYSVGFLRYIFATIPLLAICAVRKVHLPQKKDIGWFIASGTTGFFLFIIAYNVGASSVTAATSSVIIASVPVITAVLSALLLHEKLRIHQWLATAIEFIGILIITMYGAVLSANIGVLWLVLAALVLSCYNLIQKRLTHTYSALQATAFSIFIGTALLSIFAPEAIGQFSTAPLEQMIYILILAVFCSALAYITWSKAFEKAERTSQVSNYMFFTPFLTGIMEFIFIGEVPDSSIWLGGALIIIGAVIFNKQNQKDDGYKR